MATDQFENSRVSEGTLRTGAQHDGNALNESRAVSRDDIRDGFAEPEVSNMIAEGGPIEPDPNIPAADRLRTPDVVAGSTLIGHRVLKSGGEELGNIEEIMLDLKTGRIAYAVAIVQRLSRNRQQAVSSAVECPAGPLGRTGVRPRHGPQDAGGSARLRQGQLARYGRSGVWPVSP
jgi:hypothetical protein